MNVVQELLWKRNAEQHLVRAGFWRVIVPQGPVSGCGVPGSSRLIAETDTRAMLDEYIARRMAEVAAAIRLKAAELIPMRWLGSSREAAAAR